MKKASKILLTLALAISLVMPTLAAPVDYGAELENQPSKHYAQKFRDVQKSHWAFKYVAEMSDRNVLNGYPDGRFYPENNVTRGEFAKIMTLAAGLKLESGATNIYMDVENSDWYFPYIETAQYYLSGYLINGLNYYKPNDNALREDIAVALVKLKGYENSIYDLSVLDKMFTDSASISEGAKKYVAIAVEKGLVSGYEDRTFRGQAGITRAEAAAMLWRAYQYGNGNKDFDQQDKPQTTTPDDTDKKADNTKPDDSKQPDETQKPAVKTGYTVDTFAKASVSDSYLYATDDGENLYYYDNKDDAIYKVNMSSGKSTKLISLSDMKYEETETVTETVTKTVEKEVPKTITKEVEVEVPVEDADQQDTEDVTEDADADGNEDSEEDAAQSAEQPKTQTVTQTVTETVYETVTEEVTEEVEKEVLKGTYSGYSIDQLYYNTGNNTLLMIGKYTKYQGAKSHTAKGAEQQAHYVINGNKAEWYSDMSMVEDSDTYNIIRGNMADGKLLCESRYFVYHSESYGYAWEGSIIDLKNNSTENTIDGFNILMYTVGNNIYGLNTRTSTLWGEFYFANIEKYNFSTKRWESQWDDDIHFVTYGIRDKNTYLWDMSANSITIVSSDGIPKKEKINLENNLTILDFCDMPTNYDYDRFSGNGQKYSRMFITKDESFIFYDSAAGAWRKIAKQ